MNDFIEEIQNDMGYVTKRKGIETMYKSQSFKKIYFCAKMHN